MAHLEVHTGTGARRIELAGDRLTIGRSDDNLLPLVADPAVSRHHAELVAEGGDWVLRDLGSSNGTSVNGSRIDGARRLRAGDVITVGEHRLVFDGTATGAADAGGVDDYLGRDEEWNPEPSSSDDRAGAPSSSSRSPSPQMPSAAEPSPTVRTPAAQAHHLNGVVTVTGVARSVVVRPMPNAQQGESLSFRVDRYDGSGNRLPAVGVQFAPFRNGHLTEGEEVRVTGRVKRGTIHARQVRNLTTGAELTGSAGWEKAALGCGVVAVIAIFLFILAIALSGFLGVGLPGEP